MKSAAGLIQNHMTAAQAQVPQPNVPRPRRKSEEATTSAQQSGWEMPLRLRLLLSYYMCRCFTCFYIHVIYMHHKHAVSMEAREGIKSTGTGVYGGLEAAL